MQFKLIFSLTINMQGSDHAGVQILKITLNKKIKEIAPKELYKPN